MTKKIKKMDTVTIHWMVFYTTYCNYSSNHLFAKSAQDITTVMLEKKLNKIQPLESQIQHG